MSIISFIKSLFAKEKKVVEEVKTETHTIQEAIEKTIEEIKKKNEIVKSEIDDLEAKATEAVIKIKKTRAKKDS